jgi:Flp pilus assembly protein TadG
MPSNYASLAFQKLTGNDGTDTIAGVAAVTLLNLYGFTTTGTQSGYSFDPNRFTHTAHVSGTAGYITVTDPGWYKLSAFLKTTGTNAMTCTFGFAINATTGAIGPPIEVGWITGERETQDTYLETITELQAGDKVYLYHNNSDTTAFAVEECLLTVEQITTH